MPISRPYQTTLTSVGQFTCSCLRNSDPGLECILVCAQRVLVVFLDGFPSMTEVHICLAMSERLWMSVRLQSQPPPWCLYCVSCFLLGSNLCYRVLGRTPNGEDYGMSRMCPWVISPLPYDGLCSYSSLNKCIPGDFNLTAKELEIKAARVKQATADRLKERHQNQRATNAA